jgi:uncharacterized protein with HEPN domain
MDQTTAVTQIQEAAKQIALQMMKIHPALRCVNDATVKDDCLKALHEITVQLETVKKKLIRLQKDDSSSLV